MRLVIASISLQVYLEDLDHHFLIVGDVDCFKHFTVLATAKFSHQLKVILVSGKRGGERTSVWVRLLHAANVCRRVNGIFTPTQLRETRSPSTPWADEC